MQSAFGTALAGIATSFLVLHQTGSAGAMGFNLALSMLPGLLSPFMGVLVDRWPVKPPLILGNLLRGVLQLGIGFLALRGHLPVEAVYVTSFLTGLIGAFYTPAATGMVSRLVPTNQLERAVGLVQGTAEAMTMLGLIGGGFLVATIGRANALLLDGLSFLVFSVLFLFIKLPPRQRRLAEEKYWDTFKAGLNYVKSSPVLMGMAVLGLVLNAAFAPLDMLLPKRMLALGAGEAGYGLFFGLLLGGSVVGSLIFATLGSRVNAWVTSVVSLILMGVGAIGLAFSTTAFQMYIIAACFGLANALVNMCMGVIFQKRVEPEYFGRVGALDNAVGTLGMPLTLLLLVPVADRLSISAIFMVLGVLTMLAAVCWALLIRLENEKPKHPAQLAELGSQASDGSPEMAIEVLPTFPSAASLESGPR